MSYVNDAITTNENVGDFRNDNTGTDDYSYWADGSLKTDKNKGITQIDYNFLDLPQQVQLSGSKQVIYVYDGNGRKIEKKTTVSGNPQSATYYLDNALYEKQGSGNYGLYQIGHEEGRIVPINDTLRLEFNYTDHLGSLRLSFRDSLASPQLGIYKTPLITQTSQTDPWGWDIRALGFVNQSVPSKHIFTGKELQAEFGYYDFGARMSDPTIGNRFLKIDNYADAFENLTPYNYAQNNPLFYVDPSGDSSVNVNDLNMRTFDVNNDEVQLPEVKVSSKNSSSLNIAGTYGRHAYLSNAIGDFAKSIAQAYWQLIRPSNDDGSINLPGNFGATGAVVKVNKTVNGLNNIISKVLRLQKQVDEHIVGGVRLGTNSYLNSVDDAIDVLNAAHNGNATILSTNLGQNRVYVEYNNITGFYNNNGAIISTNKFLIKGGKSATVVPIHPNSTTFK